MVTAYTGTIHKPTKLDRPANSRKGKCLVEARLHELEIIGLSTQLHALRRARKELKPSELRDQVDQTLELWISKLKFHISKRKGSLGYAETADLHRTRQ